MNVDEAGNDRLAGNIYDFRARRNLNLAFWTESDDAIAGYDDVSAINDLVTFHGHDFGAAQDD